MQIHKNTGVCRVADLGLISYEEATTTQQRAVAEIHRTGGGEVLYLLEHPHVFTTGRNSGEKSILADRAVLGARGARVAASDRGGDVTYHGPGQLVGYPILLLEPGRRSIRRYVHDLEEIILRTLSDFGIKTGRRDGYVGVWVNGRKIASIGVRISRWVTCHGFALNVNTDLSYFSLIRPCGIEGCEMTSMERLLGSRPSLDEVKRRTAAHFSDVFGRRVEFTGALAGGGVSTGVGRRG